MSFVTAGEATKPTALLLHGFPNSARMFRDVVPELSQAAYVIAPDLPGFGESDFLPEVSFAALNAGESATTNCGTSGTADLTGTEDMS